MSYKLYIKLDDNLPDNIKEYYKKKSIESQNGNEDAGFDLLCPDDIEIKFGNVAKIDFKIKCAMRDSENNLVAYNLYTRSSFYKYPLQMTNNVGVIDKGYRGNIGAFVRYYSLNNDEFSDLTFFKELKNKVYNIAKESRLFQLTGPSLNDLEVFIVDNLPESKRGENGFGSTGIKI
jgi:dUTP pyrophosphatase